jgi:2-haloacid dehalogenase
MRYRATLFDAYGTLFDVHSAVMRRRERIGPAAEALSALWRTKHLEYSWTGSLAGDFRPFDMLAAEALDFALARHPPLDPTVREDLIAAYRVLDAFPEAAAVLAGLRRAGLVAGIFTNGTEAMIAAALSASGLAGLVDRVITVGPVGRYKPDPAVYAHAAAVIGVAPGETLFVSSNRWDVMGAARQGFAACWINRTGQPDEYRHMPPLAVVGDLSAIPSIAGAG